MGEPNKPQQYTTKQVAAEFTRLRSSPDDARKSILATQKRLDKELLPATSSEVRHTRATW
jgi:hypothetical protein